MNSIILCDADGVLLNWVETFRIWVEKKGYFWHDTPSYEIKEVLRIKEDHADALVRTFNESAAILSLNQMPGASEWVNAGLSSLGYRLRVITSLSNCPYAGEARRRNLARWFGDNIESVICLDCGQDKEEALLPYKDTNMWWIEDKKENAEAGRRLGLRTILFDHAYNLDHDAHPDIHRVKSWEEIYHIIKNEGIS